MLPGDASSDGFRRLPVCGRRACFGRGHRVAAVMDLLFIRLCACTVLLFGAYHALTPILPVFFAQRQMNGLQVGALLSAFLAASLLVRPFAGVLSDRVAPAWLMTMGLLGFAACAAAYPFAPGFWPLLAARLIQGASYALFYTGAAASLLSQSPPQRKAEALAWFGNAIKIAMAAAPLWGSGWRAGARWPLSGCRPLPRWERCLWR